MSVEDDLVGSGADPSSAPLREHIKELRQRLLLIIGSVGFTTIAIFIFFQKQLMALIQWPVSKYLNSEDAVTFSTFIATAPTEALFTVLKVAFYAGLLVAMPYVLFQIWRFVAPGLLKNEQRAGLPFILSSPFLLAAGASLCYFIVMPWAFGFLIGFTQNLGFDFLPKIDQYAAFFMRMVLAFGIAFQLPVALALLTMAGLVRPSNLAKQRRYAVVACMVAAATLTPPDGITMIMLFIPLYGLYEASIIICRGIERRQVARNPYLDPDYQDPVGEDSTDPLEDKKA